LPAAQWAWVRALRRSVRCALSTGPPGVGGDRAPAEDRLLVHGQEGVVMASRSFGEVHGLDGVTWSSGWLSVKVLGEDGP